MGNGSAVALVEARGLRKNYGSTRAVNNLSFKVARGEVVGFLGPNGAGKSTTMKMLTGFLRPNAGTALIHGIDVAEQPQRAQAMLGYLPENAPLYDDMMVLDFLNYVADLRAVAQQGRRERLQTICSRCGLGSVLGKDIGQLSKGFRQRVGLAQALLHDPDLLILDEPTSGLDPNQIVEIRELIKELGRDKTVILSTHILPEVQATCDRIIIINDGELVADDRTDAMMGEGASVIRLVVKGAKGNKVARENLAAMLQALPGVHHVDASDAEGSGTFGFRLRALADSDPREAVFAAAVANNWVVLSMHREAVSLEDTFRRLTRQKEAANA